MGMTIDKAIELLQTECCVPNSVFLQDRYQAIALGIEALKAIKCGREGLRTEFLTPLYGESKD